MPQKIVVELNPSTIFYILVIVLIGIMAINQYLILDMSGSHSIIGNVVLGGSSSGKELSKVDLSEIKSTGHSIAALFDVENIKNTQDAIDVMIPTGTPDYGEALGVSFDDPINSMNVLVDTYKKVQLSPEDQQRYINLATKPVGISCEFCCGVGPVGITNNGQLRCGCQHSPALQGLTKWLIQNTDYSDAEVLKEVLRWKSLFFPKNMVDLALKVAGGDTSALGELPGMVGGC